MKFYTSLGTALTLLASTSLMASEIDATTSADLIQQIQDGRSLPSSESLSQESTYQLLQLYHEALNEVQTDSLFKDKDTGQVLLLNNKLQPCQCAQCTALADGLEGPITDWERTLLGQAALSHAAFQCAENLLNKVNSIFTNLKNDRKEYFGDMNEQYQQLQDDYKALLDSIRNYKKDVVTTIQAHKGHCFTVVEMDPETFHFDESPLVKAYTQLVESYEAHFLSVWTSIHEISAGTEGSTGALGATLNKIDYLRREMDFYTNMKKELLQTIADRTEQEMGSMQPSEEVQPSENEDENISEAPNLDDKEI